VKAQRVGGSLTSNNLQAGEYTQVAHFEIAAEIDAMRTFSGTFAAADGAPVLLMWCTSGEIFCYSLDRDAAARDEDSARSVTLWNGHADDKQDLACMVDSISVDGVPGHVAHVATAEMVALLSPSLDKLWDVQVRVAVRLSHVPSTPGAYMSNCSLSAPGSDCQPGSDADIVTTVDRAQQSW
jgi:hypothetical protein